MRDSVRERIIDDFGTGTGSRDEAAIVQYISPKEPTKIELLDYHGLGHDLVQADDHTWQLITEGSAVAIFFAEDAYMAVAIVVAIWNVYASEER